MSEAQTIREEGAMSRVHNHTPDGHHWQDCPACDDARRREALIAYLRDTIDDTALLIEDHRNGKETDRRWGWFADGILDALRPSRG